MDAFIDPYILKQIINGLAIGSIYALVAVGYNMVYGMLELINFAHGDIYMFGTFIALTLLVNNVPIPIAIILACAAGGTIGLIVERLAYRPVRNAARVVPMLSAVGVALIFRNLAQLIWGTSTKPFPELFKPSMIHFGDVQISTLQIIIMVLAMSLTGIFALIMNKTKLGKATHSVAQDIPTAKLMGISVNRIIQFVYFAGGFFGVAGGILFSMTYATWIGMGFLGTLKAWIACVIGGIGSIKGAFFGGIILGLSEALISGFVSSAYRDAIAYGLVIIVLVVWPKGIFGSQIAEKV
ncbi:MAG: High-affinity branched-chain amino acid transport system permease protein LivH [Anaerolineae bacterium]|nr:High-affinity branched-chain amino acid transport system permease protein LivH [Anaerolineae bacterium]